MDGESVTVLLAGTTPIGGSTVSRGQQTEIGASIVEPHPPCPHCGANRKILTDLDVRTRLLGAATQTLHLSQWHVPAGSRWSNLLRTVG